MNKFHLTLLPILLISCSIFSQNDCERANSRIVAAYSHLKKAYDSRNITDIKYFSVRSKESFENSKIDLETCGCEIAHKKALDAINLLTKVATVDIYEDARFFVKRTRDIAKEAMISIDECSYKSTNKVSVNESAAILTNNDQNMLDLQKQQLVLKQQQDALETKAEEIKLQLMSEQLKKNRALIERYKAIITTNIKTFNHSL